jgi:thiosulfate sulfurtransferase
MPLLIFLLLLWRKFGHRLMQACEERARRYEQRPPGRLNSVERRLVMQARSHLNASNFPLTHPQLHNPQENDMSDIHVNELALWRKAGFEHVLIDVRRDIKRAAEADEISGGQWHNPAAWLEWKDAVAATAPGQPVVVYCAYGHELSQALAACLRALGRDARHLVGGIEEWRKAALPVVNLQQP